VGEGGKEGEPSPGEAGGGRVGMRVGVGRTLPAVEDLGKEGGREGRREGGEGVGRGQFGEQEANRFCDSGEGRREGEREEDKEGGDGP